MHGCARGPPPEGRQVQSAPAHPKYGTTIFFYLFSIANVLVEKDMSLKVVLLSVCL